MICPSRQTSRPKFDLNSHSDGLRQTNGRFSRLGGMKLAKEPMVCGKFAWKLSKLAVLNSHYSTKPSDDLSVRTVCSSSSVKTAIVASSFKSQLFKKSSLKLFALYFESKLHDQQRKALFATNFGLKD